MVVWGAASAACIPLRSLRSASPFAVRKGTVVVTARSALGDEVGTRPLCPSDISPRAGATRPGTASGIPLRSLRSASPFAVRKGTAPRTAPGDH